MQSRILITFGILAALGMVPVPAAIIGTNRPAEPLTWSRIQKLPGAESLAWREYLNRSAALRRADQALLQKEMGGHGLAQSLIPPTGRGIGSIPLRRSPEWYATAEAVRIADNIISFQTPSGGWSKNLEVSDHARQPGEGFAPDNSSAYVGLDDQDALRDIRWNYVGTIDNGATTAELRYLARIMAAANGEPDARHRAAFLRGLDYLLAAQNPNGGWPQVWPLQGGYHDAITYNDGAMLNVLELLRDAAAGAGDFQFVPVAARERASVSLRRGIQCLLATQVVVAGQKTAWCQQHDALTLNPTAARNYEMASLCSAESAGIVNFLMQLPGPDSNTVAAVRSAAAWLEQTRLKEVAFKNVGDQGRLLVPDPVGGPLWARFYEIGTNRPIFGERDRTIHDRVDDISKERRQGYAWYTDGPADVLKRFAKWNESRQGASLRASNSTLALIWWGERLREPR